MKPFDPAQGRPVAVLTTVGAEFDARTLAQTLVEARLAACVNIIDGIHSVYRWEGSVANDDEKLLVIKTADMRLDALRDELFKHHPYEVPELVVVPIESMSEGYRAWLLGSIL